MLKLFNLTIALFLLIISKEISCELKLTNEVDLPTLGKLIGVELPGFANGSYEAFFGIPYAEPPIGKLRFANPVAVKPWKDAVLNATEEKPICIQKNYLSTNMDVMGEEDCLYLNIYRPICEKCIKLPVMVYIHGGGFFSGYPGMEFSGPEYFMDTKRVILVTLAYRLGALGFLSTNDSAMPGNFGFKDQRMAIKFVKDNIQHFNGDPNKITIFGQSAGGASTHLQLITQTNQDLFSKAIVMSGSALAPFAEPVPDPKKQAYMQGEFAGIENVWNLNTNELVEKLREIDAKKIIEAGDKFKGWQIDPLVVFRNVIEDPKDPEAFLTKHPKELVSSDNYKKIPWMIGMVAFEGAVRSLKITEFPNELNDFNKDFDNLFKKLLRFPGNDKEFNTIIDHYMKGIHEVNNQTKDGFGKIISDSEFIYPIYKSIKAYIDTAKKEDPPLFVYRFNYEGPYSFSTIFTSKPEKHGAVHCDDLIYLFRIHLMDQYGWKPFEVDSVDHKMVKLFLDAFISFAESYSDEKTNKIPVCNKKDFYSESMEQICDYREFTNDSNGNLVIRNNNQFNEKDMKFWENLLHQNTAQ